MGIADTPNPIDNDLTEPAVPPLSPYRPKPLVSFEDRDNAVNLTFGDYDYDGTLTTNWADRLLRIHNLGTAAMRLLLGFLGGIDFIVNITINLPNPFSNPDRPDSVAVNKKGFAAIIEMLNLLHRKIDNLHEDLPYIVPVASVVEHWQLSKEAMRPQCIFLFGEWEEGDEFIGPPKWQTCVPWFDFSRATTFTNEWGYMKGAKQGILTLDDNSKVIVYADTEATIERLFNRYLQGIPADKKEQVYTKIGDYKGPPFSTRYVRLRRIDYYSNGRLRGPMDDYAWFDRAA